MRRSLFCLLVVVPVMVLVAGCQRVPFKQTTVEAAGDPSNARCTQIDFLGVTESSEVTSTWRYRVQEQPCAQTPGGWTLELPACATVVDASPSPWKTASPDANSSMSGIRWQTGADFQSGEFSVTLTGDLVKGTTRVSMDGQGAPTVSLDGPVCKGQEQAATSSPLAKATVKVQSAYCRANPVGKAEKVVVLYRNQEAEIVGRNDNPNNPWWYVKLPDQGKSCWLWGKTTTTSGAVEGVPVVK